MRAPDRLIALGVFGAPHGARGELRVKSYTGDPQAIGRYGALTDGTGARVFAFEALRPIKNDMLVARVKEVDTREAAQALTGVEIFARRRQLPPPDKDEYYYSDLVALETATPEGERLGKVAAVLNYGAGDILEIARADGESLLLPFSKAVVVDVRFDEGRIIVAPPREIEGEERE